MKRLGILLAISFLLQPAAKAQKMRCMNDEIAHKIILEHPGKAAAIINQQHSNEIILAHLKDKAVSANKTTAQVTIPVVFHIVVTQSQLNNLGGTAGVALRVDSQLAVLNRDYNGASLDQAQIPADFQPLYGNPQIHFGLAHRKPDGTGTPGYEITTITQQGFSPVSGTAGSTLFASDAKYTSAGGADAWDPTKYLNVWVINFSTSGLLGISPPYSFANSIVPLAEIGPAISYATFGKSGPGQLYFFSGANEGRTLVHELGHTFELLHIWGNTSVGSGDCSDDDGISDTPQQNDANTVCPTTFRPNCNNTPEGEMYMNFMDYVDDACYKMFTLEQAGVINYQVTDPAGNAYGLSQHPELLEYPTSVGTLINENIVQLYPNPTKDAFDIIVDYKNSMNIIVITDVLGRTVKTINIADKQFKTHHVDMNGFNAGVYYVQCIFANGKLTKKIILQ